MNVEFGNDNRFKKRVSKAMMANFAADKGFAPSLGSTAPDAKGFDNLETALEDVETKAEIVADQLNRDAVLRLQDPTQFQAPSGIVGFFKAVKHGITALKKTNFTGLPRSDIASLESYLERLNAFDFTAKIADLLLQYVPGAVDFPEEAALVAEEQALLNLRMPEAAAELERIVAARLADPTVRGRAEALRLIQAIKLEQERLESNLARVRRELDRGRRFTQTKMARSGLLEKDLALVVPAFKVLIDSLAAGIQAYNAGISGKNVIIGSGEYRVAMGGISYMPRRFM